jgi:hypothetical protein
MNRNFRNSRGLFKHDGNRNPRWRKVVIALVLVLAIGSAGQTPTVQAAPTGDTSVTFSLTAYKVSDQRRVCIGDEVLINAKVNSGASSLPAGQSEGSDELATLSTALPGIRIKALVRDTLVGSIAPPERDTGWTAGGIPNVAPFVFHAKNPGRTTITFEAKIPTQWYLGMVYRQDIVTDTVEITVEQCEYKVTVISTFRVGMTSVGEMKEEVIILDQDGQFEGTSVVDWVTSVICGIDSPILHSQAVITAEPAGDDLKVVVTFHPSSSIGGGNCLVGYVPTSNDTDPTLSPLTIIVPSWGGTVTVPQTVKAKNGSFTGSALIIVEPVHSR